MENTTDTKKRPERKGVRYELYLPAEMDSDLKAMKERSGNSVASIIRSAIRTAIDQEKAAV